MAAKQKPVFSSVYETDEEKQDRHIDRAETAMLVVAVLTLIYSIYSWFDLDNRIAEAMQSRYYAINKAVVADIRMLIIVSFVLGLIYLGLYYWSKTQPFKATLIALLLYGGNFFMGVFLDPGYLRSGLLIKGAIIVILAMGVVAAQQQEKERKEEAKREAAEKAAAEQQSG